MITISKTVSRRIGLLIAALIVLAVAVQLTAAQSTSPDIDRYEYDILGFEQQDARVHSRLINNTNALNDVAVFVGSSTFARWNELEKIFAPFHAINRGFGGSTIAEVTHYADRIIAPLRPKEIMFYAGSNDIADPWLHSGQQVYDDFREFVHVVQAKLPNTEIYFISMSVAPSRLQYLAEFEEGNRLIRDFAKTQTRVHFIDVSDVMHDSTGRLRDEFFDATDHLHMSPDGYAAWIPLIESELAQHRLLWATP
jgi:lysophospholipase L1-like esterase